MLMAMLVGDDLGHVVISASVGNLCEMLKGFVRCGTKLWDCRCRGEERRLAVGCHEEVHIPRGAMSGG